MRKLIRQIAGRFVLQVIIISILFPALLLAWGRKPAVAPVELVTAPLCLQTARPSGSLTDADLVEMARRYRMISDARTGFTAEQMARLREIRPDICIVRYLNFAAVYRPGARDAVLRNHPDWVMRDENGYPVPSRLGGRGLMMRPNSGGWRDHLSWMASMYMSIDYDGIMADEVVMCGRLKPNFAGINTETDRPYTTEEYRSHQVGLVRAVKLAIGEESLVLNNVRQGIHYFGQAPYAFLEAADGVVAEGFRGSPRFLFDHHLSETTWLANVEMMVDVQARDKAIVAVVKIDKAVADRYTAQELKTYEQFWYCTFLLGMQDSAYYTAYVTDPDPNKKTLLFSKEHEIDLGEPLGEFYKTAKGYGRGFEWAWVYVDLTKRTGMIIRKHRIEDEKIGH